jgi:glutamine amidotransferase
MIAIIDYGMGNLRSLENALGRLGAEFEVTSDPSVILSADRVVLPGVGNAGKAVDNLQERGLVDVIKSVRRPVLGICVGMQVLCLSSEEAPGKEGLGIFDTRVRRFPATSSDKVPHMGWNTLSNMEGKLLKGLPRNPWFYFVHSYYASTCTDTVATCSYAGIMFSAVLRYENFYGTQFHPEKSGDAGEAILKNFLEL